MDRKMQHFTTTSTLPFFFYLFFSIISSFTIVSSTQIIKQNPFTAKASLIRYWNKQISNNLPKPSFLLSKSSPLSAVDAAFFTKLAAQKSLNSHLATFCSAADLFCLSDTSKPPPNRDANFAFYNNKKFSNYGTSRFSGTDIFKNYSGGNNFASSSFTRYSRSSIAHHETFTTYASDANVANSTFTSYSAAAAAGSSEFKNYNPTANVNSLDFTSYDSDGKRHGLSFTRYVDDTNSGNEAFVSYAKKGNSTPVDFTNYGNTSNVIGSTFSSYTELGSSGNNSFKGYSFDSNNPKNNFKGYGTGIKGGTDTFSSYRDSANAGSDTFQSYGKSSRSEKSSFVNYGKSFNEGADTFREYGKGTTTQLTDFKMYGLNSTFKEYARTGISFGLYSKPRSNFTDADSKLRSRGKSGNSATGRFFREHMLKEGVVMRMPDIRDKMPKRSFLPRSISSKIPFSTNQLSELKQVFGATQNSNMERILVNALAECERVPSAGESKRCVGSVEDMIDFAVSVLGHNVVARTTENVSGSKKLVMIGKVKGINGGNVTKSVSCHQSLYPYLLYYCHSVPKVRVYEADILDVESKAKINHGVAICHEDTSAWSPGHGAFVALGSSPGKIEVCHWIFENDMTWARAN